MRKDPEISQSDVDIVDVTACIFLNGLETVITSE